MTPFILMERIKLPPEGAPSKDQAYDSDKQLWIDTNSNQPVVSLMAGGYGQSQFGETTITETREGADSSETASIEASQFGETSVSKSAEGIDQIGEISAFLSPDGVELESSRFGETQVTSTSEGHDQPEMAMLEISQFGETSLTRTTEGHDQPEIVALNYLQEAP